MIINDILKEINDNGAIIKNWNLGADGTKYDIWSYSWDNNKEIRITTVFTNKCCISLTIKQRKGGEEKFSIVCDVVPRKHDDKYKPKMLSYAREYTSFNLEILKSWMVYVKNIKDVLNKTEDVVEKIISSEVRKARIFKDEVL